MQDRKNFIHINESFKCQNCGYSNSALDSGCRNHCQKCLYSLHVDKLIPGDRQSNCHNLMKPIALNYSGKKGYIIIHQCLMCFKKQNNKSAPDDDIDQLCLLSQKNK